MIVAQVSFTADSKISEVLYEQHTGKYIDDDRITVSREMFRTFLVLQGTDLFQPKQIQKAANMSPKQLQYILCNYDKLCGIFNLTIDEPSIAAESDEIVEAVKQKRAEQGGST